MMNEEPNMSEKPALFIIDNKQLEHIYDAVYTPLCVYVSNYITDNQVVQDIAQGAFILLWEQKERFQTLITAKAFLYRVSRNAAIDHLRKLKTRDKFIAENLRESEYIVEDVITNEMSALMIEILNTLPPESRKVLLLTLEGKSYKEVAELLGISINTVKNQRISALKHVRKKSEILYIFLTMI